MFSHFLPAIAGVASLIAFYLPGQASAITFNFSQPGFSEGAVLSGFFEAEDLNNDGLISFFDEDITDFGASFTGNSLIPAFTLSPANFVDIGFGSFGIVFVLKGDTILGDDEIGVSEGMAFGVDIGGDVIEFAAGPGPLILCDGVSVECGRFDFGRSFDLTTEFMIVTTDAAVPLPASALLLLSGVAAVGAVARRRV